MLGKNVSRSPYGIFFLFFLESRIRYFMQIVSLGICTKCQILFSRKNKENIVSLSSAEFAPRMVIVNLHLNHLRQFWRDASIHVLFVMRFNGSLMALTKKNISIMSSQLKLREDPTIILLTHLSLASHKRDIGKQCRPRSDAAECGIWSGSTLFALISEFSTKHNNDKN